jgi:sugar fermentation stimulation protein A
MHFAAPLIRARLVKRYKRFLADVVLEDGGEATATCPNTGSMMGLAVPGARVWLSHSQSPTRKYALTLEVVEADLGAGPTLVGINTGHPNHLVEEAIRDRRIGELAGYGSLRREVKYGDSSRIDLLLEDERRPPCYVEVKNVHLARTHGLVEFPDSVTERGMKHLRELARMVEAGNRAVMVFLVQRSDGRLFRLARDVDPAYGEAFDAARAAGVEMLCYACRVTPEEIAVERAVPIGEPLPARRTPRAKSRRR